MNREKLKNLRANIGQWQNLLSPIELTLKVIDALLEEKEEEKEPVNPHEWHKCKDCGIYFKLPDKCPPKEIRPQAGELWAYGPTFNNAFWHYKKNGKLYNIASDGSGEKGDALRACENLNWKRIYPPVKEGE